MPRIQAHTVDDAPEASRGLLERLQATYGRVLNVHAGMAHAPAVLAGYAGIKRAVADHGSFGPRTREAIALAVGAVDGCAYCQSAHTGAARRAGWTLEQTVALRGGEPVPGDEKLTALLAVARQIAGRVGEVDDETWAQAQAAGWGDEELAELFVYVMANIFTNYFNHYARTELDVPPAPGIEPSAITGDPR